MSRNLVGFFGFFSESEFSNFHCRSLVTAELRRQWAKYEELRFGEGCDEEEEGDDGGYWGAGERGYLPLLRNMFRVNLETDRPPVRPPGGSGGGGAPPARQRTPIKKKQSQQTCHYLPLVNTVFPLARPSARPPARSSATKRRRSRALCASRDRPPVRPSVRPSRMP